MIASALTAGGRDGASLGARRDKETDNQPGGRDARRVTRGDVEFVGLAPESSVGPAHGARSPLAEGGHGLGVLVDQREEADEQPHEWANAIGVPGALASSASSVRRNF